MLVPSPGLHTRWSAWLMVLVLAFAVPGGLGAQAAPCGPAPERATSPTRGAGAYFDADPTLRWLTQQADVGLQARVRGWQSYSAPQGIQTDVQLEVERVLLGTFTHRAAALTLVGGELDGVRDAFAETPALARGELVVVLARQTPDGRLRLVDDFLGALSVTPSCAVPAAGLALDALVDRVARAARGELPDHEDVAVATEVRPHWADLGTGPWPAFRQPVPYYTNSSSGRPGTLTDLEVVAAWTNGFQPWDQGSPGLSTAHAGPTTRTQAVRDGFNDVLWSSGYSPDSPVLATTSFRADAAGLREFDITFNNKKPFTTNGVDGRDLETVMVHEAGHAIGLAHSSDETAVMYYRYHGVLRTLTPDDLAGLYALYGDPSGTATPSPSATGTATPTPLPTTASAPPTTTATRDALPSASPTGTPAVTATASRTPTVTASATASPTATASPSLTATASPSLTASPSRTLTPSPSTTRTATVSPTVSLSPTGTASPTRSPTPTATAIPTETPEPSATRTPTRTATAASTPSATASMTASATSTATPSPSPSPSPSGLPTATPTPSATPSPLPTASATSTPSSTATPSPTTVATSATPVVPTPSATPLPLGGRGLTLQVEPRQLSWQGGAGQTGYQVVRWSEAGGLVILPAGVGMLPPNATSYRDIAPPAGPSCYLLLIHRDPLAAAFSDALCAVSGIATGQAPGGLRLRLNQGSTAALDWEPVASGETQLLWVLYLDAASGSGPIVLPPGATGAQHETDGRMACFVVVAFAGASLAGATDAVCAVPGVATLPTGSAWPPHLLRSPLPGPALW